MVSTFKGITPVATQRMDEGGSVDSGPPAMEPATMVAYTGGLVRGVERSQMALKYNWRYNHQDLVRNRM